MADATEIAGNFQSAQATLKEELQISNDIYEAVINCGLEESYFF